MRAQMDGQMVRITQMRIQMDSQMIRIAQMRSSEDEDSDGSDGWSDGQDNSDEELRRCGFR